MPYSLAEQIKKEIRKVAQPGEKAEIVFVEKYLGTKRKFLCLKAADRDRIIQRFLGQFKNLSPEITIKNLDELFASDTFEDFNLAGKLLTKLPDARLRLPLIQIEKWIAKSNGWAECDCICQSLFEEKEILARWPEFKKYVEKWQLSKNVQLRRASLVIQTKTARKTADPKLTNLAYRTINQLKSESWVLITKAVSWLLRSLASKNPAEVLKYLENNRLTLPAIAYRETMKKITTGKK